MKNIVSDAYITPSLKFFILTYIMIYLNNKICMSTSYEAIIQIVQNDNNEVL